MKVFCLGSIFEYRGQKPIATKIINDHSKQVFLENILLQSSRSKPQLLSSLHLRRRHGEHSQGVQRLQRYVLITHVVCYKINVLSWLTCE